MKSLIKGLVNLGEFQYLNLLRRIAGMDAMLHRIQKSRNPLPILRNFGAKIGENTRIYPGITIHAAEKNFANLTIGSNVRIVRDCIIDLTDEVTIADNAILSFRCSLITHMDIYRSPLVEAGYKATKAPIHIGRGAVLFTNSVVLKGVTIGECAMIAAGSVVTNDVPPWTLVGGIPAKFLKKIIPVSEL